jgi:hypothetical protein
MIRGCSGDNAVGDASAHPYGRWPYNHDASEFGGCAKFRTAPEPSSTASVEIVRHSQNVRDGGAASGELLQLGSKCCGRRLLPLYDPLDCSLTYVKHTMFFASRGRIL